MNNPPPLSSNRTLPPCPVWFGFHLRSVLQKRNQDLRVLPLEPGSFDATGTSN
jgi:hypothetical protein